jgi:hypothetical protein
MWIEGKGAKSLPLVFDHNATRWGLEQELIPAGQKIVLDARPVIIEVENFQSKL